MDKKYLICGYGNIGKHILNEFKKSLLFMINIKQVLLFIRHISQMIDVY